MCLTSAHLLVQIKLANWNLEGQEELLLVLHLKKVRPIKKKYLYYFVYIYYSS